MLCGLWEVRIWKPAAESKAVVLFVSMLAQPLKKMTPQPAKMRIRIELISLGFIVRCVLTNLDLQEERTSTADVNSVLSLSPKTIMRELNGDDKHPQGVTR